MLIFPLCSTIFSQLFSCKFEVSKAINNFFREYDAFVNMDPKFEVSCMLLGFQYWVLVFLFRLPKSDLEAFGLNMDAVDFTILFFMIFCLFALLKT